MGLKDTLEWLTSILISAEELKGEIAVLSTKCEHLADRIAELSCRQENYVNKISSDNENLKSQVAKIEAKFEAVIMASVKEAITNIVRENADQQARISSLVAGHLADCGYNTDPTDSTSSAKEAK